MSPERWSLVALIVLAASSVAGAQTTSPAKPAIDFSNDPCGSPLVENQVWYSIDGTVATIEDGSTVLITPTKGHSRLKVRLVGIAVEQSGAFADQAKGRVSKLALNKSVEVWVNPDWLYHKKKPTAVTGVVYLRDGTDVGLSLVATGFARAETPRPYTMSNYTFCTYREAESKAKSDQLGIWQ